MIEAITYYRLGCLMREFLSHILVNHAFGLHELYDMGKPPQTVVLVSAQSGTDAPPIHVPDKTKETVPAEIRPSLLKNLRSLETEIKKLQLRASYDAIQLMLNTLTEDDYYPYYGLARDADHLHHTLVSELKHTTSIALWGDSEKLYQAERLFGEQVQERFPDTGQDIAEAGKCLALDRGTACAMHLQRVLECGLDALGKEVGVTKPLRDWGKYVQEIAAELKRRFEVSGARTADEQFYAETYVVFDAMRRAWRNPFMHVDKTCAPDQAVKMFETVKAFMQHLATRLRQPISTDASA